MGFWARLFGSAERKAGPLDILRELYGGAPVKSGQSITTETALQVTTVFGCLRVLADGVAQVPLKLYRESEDGRKRAPAKDHPLYKVLARKTNDWQTSFEFRETLMLHTPLTGAFYAFKNRVRGEIVELIPFEPGHVTVKRHDRRYDLRYEVRFDDGSREEFPAADIWHVKGPSWNSWMGLKAVQLAREAIGLALATEEHHASLHKNSAKAGGVLAVEGKLTETEYKRLKAWIAENYEGAHNAAKTWVMDRAAKFTPHVITGVDSEHLATRKYQIEEICRAFRVMPIMVGYSDKNATYASVEQMFLAHVVHTLSPWYERLEQSINTNLLTDDDARAGIYAKFNANGLMRGAAADRATYFTKALGAGGTKGWLTQNQVRALEEEDAMDDPAADELPQPPTQQGDGDKGDEDASS